MKIARFISIICVLMISLSISAYADYYQYSDENISFDYLYEWSRLRITDEQEAAGYKLFFTNESNNYFGYYQVNMYDNLPEDVKKDFSLDNIQESFTKNEIAKTFDTTASSVSITTVENNEFYKVTIDDYMSENGSIDITGLITIDNGYMHGFVFYGDRWSSDYDSFLIMPSTIKFTNKSTFATKNNASSSSNTEDKATSPVINTSSFENTTLYKTVISIASGTCIAIFFLIYKVIKKKQEQAKCKNTIFKELNDEMPIDISSSKFDNNENKSKFQNHNFKPAKSADEYITVESPRPLTWFYFHTYFRLPFSILQYIIYLITFLKTSLTTSNTELAIIASENLYFWLVLTNTVLAIISIIGLIKKTRDGYLCNFLFILIHAIMNMTFTGNIETIIGSVFAGIILIVLQFVYFIKRGYLFFYDQPTPTKKIKYSELKSKELSKHLKEIDSKFPEFDTTQSSTEKTISNIFLNKETTLLDAYNKCYNQIFLSLRDINSPSKNEFELNALLQSICEDTPMLPLDIIKKYHPITNQVEFSRRKALYIEAAQGNLGNMYEFPIVWNYTVPPLLDTPFKMIIALFGNIIVSPSNMEIYKQLNPDVQNKNFPYTEIYNVILDFIEIIKKEF